MYLQYLVNIYVALLEKYTLCIKEDMGIVVFFISICYCALRKLLYDGLQVRFIREQGATGLLCPSG